MHHHSLLDHLGVVGFFWGEGGNGEVGEVFQNKVSLCSFVCLGTHFVDPLVSASQVLGIKVLCNHTLG